MGVLGDWENPYLSLNKSFEADTVRALGRIIANGHLEKGEKPVHFCMDCGSALAEAEVEYKDKKSHSIDVKFKVMPQSIESLCNSFKINNIKDAYFVIWTTTPWTIPSNVAVCINKNIDYILVKSSNEHFIIAKDLLDACSERWDLDLEVLASVQGKDIENISIEHLHLNRSQKKNMVSHLNKNGYSYFGNGYDHKNFDYLFKKEKIIWNRFLSNFLWLVSHKKVKYFNKFFLKGSE